MKYSTWLKSIQKASGWSQEEMARQLGVSFATLNAWFNNRTEPRKKAAEKIKILYFDIVGVDSINLDELTLAKENAAKLKTTVKKITEDKATLDRLTLYLTYHTNTIEGSTMTFADTEAVLFQNKVLANRTQVEQAEIHNHQTVLLWLLGELQQKDFTIDEQLIKGLHLRLMNGIITNAGVYRNHGVRIVGTRTIVANHARIPSLMEELIRGLDSNPTDLIAEIAFTHAAFEQIHPFSDGNGRIGRLIMLAQALRANHIPPLILRERKFAYYKYLEFAQTRDNKAPLQWFIAESMAAANQLLFRR